MNRQAPRCLAVCVCLFLLAACGSSPVSAEAPPAPEKREPRSAEFGEFRRFYQEQRREGLDGWEISYLLSLGYAREELEALPFQEKRRLLLPGIVGVSVSPDSEYEGLDEAEKQRLAGWGIDAGTYQGLYDLGFREIHWRDQEWAQAVLPLETLRERLSPGVIPESLSFQSYPESLDFWIKEAELQSNYARAAQRGFSSQDVKALLNDSWRWEEILETAPLEELEASLWGLPLDAGREEQLACLGYTPEEMDRLDPGEEAYIFPFATLRQRMGADGFDGDTISSMRMSSPVPIPCKFFIRLIVENQQP